MSHDDAAATAPAPRHVIRHVTNGFHAFSLFTLDAAFFADKIASLPYAAAITPSARRQHHAMMLPLLLPLFAASAMP